MHSQTILVAEDDEPVAAFLIELLEHFEYHSVLCSSGEEALRIASTLQPQLVIIGLDGRGDFAPGWAAARKMARLVPGSHRIMLSTSQPIVDEVGITERGRLFAAGLLKPFQIDQFTALLARLYQPQLPDIRPGLPCQLVSDGLCRES